MKKSASMATIVFVCTVFFAFISCDAYLDGVDEVVVDELDRLSVRPTADAEVRETTLPDNLDEGANWGLKTIICAEGGYDLYPYAGQTVTMTSINIRGNCGSYPVRIFVLSTEEAIACTYLAIREGGSAAPGVWAVNGSECNIAKPTTVCN